jgi:hypothetical protein
MFYFLLLPMTGLKITPKDVSYCFSPYFFDKVAYLNNNIICVDGSRRPSILLSFDENANIIKRKTKNSFIKEVGKTKDSFIYLSTRRKSKKAHSNIVFQDSKLNWLKSFNIAKYINRIKIGKNKVVTFCKDNRLRVFDTQGKLLFEKKCSTHLRDIHISNNNSILISFVDTAQLLNPIGEVILEWSSNPKRSSNTEDWIYSVYANEDSTKLFLGCYSGWIYCINLNGEILWEYNTKGIVDKIYSSKSGNSVVTYSSSIKNSNIHFLKKSNFLKRGKCIKTLKLNFNEQLKRINEDIFVVTDKRKLLFFDIKGNLLNELSFDENIKTFDVYNSKLVVITNELLLFDLIK